jgi:hypothetical protein
MAANSLGGTQAGPCGIGGPHSSPSGIAGLPHVGGEVVVADEVVVEVVPLLS